MIQERYRTVFDIQSYFRHVAILTLRWTWSLSYGYWALGPEPVSDSAVGVTRFVCAHVKGMGASPGEG